MLLLLLFVRRHHVVITVTIVTVRNCNNIHSLKLLVRGINFL